MKIIMLTNVYLPVVGGITRSIQAFTEQYRQRGHEVLIVAPNDHQPENEHDVVRFPAIPKVYQNRYSLPLPIPGYLYSTFEQFQPDVIHSHHPFLIGLIARREAALWNVPLVYTHHTRYDVYLETQAHLPAPIAQLLAQLWTNYCELCEAVIAPSESIASLLRQRGVTHRMEVIPTGVDVQLFAQGDGALLRQRVGIPPDAFVVGHVGRLAPEKNCRFLAEAIAAFLQRQPQAHFLVAGEGASFEALARVFRDRGLSNRFHPLGTMDKSDLVDVYHAMDVFAFASHSETQGMVLTEAMAAGVPVVAVAASGVNDVVRDGINGRLLAQDNVDDFGNALEWILHRSDEERRELHGQAEQTANHFSIQNCAERALQLYESVIAHYETERRDEEGPLATIQRILSHEWEAIRNGLDTLGHSILH